MNIIDFISKRECSGWFQVHIQEQKQKLQDVTLESEQHQRAVEMLQVDLDQANTTIENLNTIHKTEREQYNTKVQEFSEAIAALQATLGEKEVSVSELNQTLETERYGQFYAGYPT